MAIFLFGLLLGVAFIGALGSVAFKYRDKIDLERIHKVFDILRSKWRSSKLYREEFRQPIQATGGSSFGPQGQLTFELYRQGKFQIDGSGYAWQKSDHYGDVAVIRSTRPLPQTYKITIVAGAIDYGLEKLDGLSNDPQYPEGPANENGCYLLAITDVNPAGHHTNIWWHQHRKLVVDVDNNVWGHGMPNPIFMVYFDRDNKMMSFPGEEKTWQPDWRAAAHYDPSQWYRIDLEKTAERFLFTLSQENGPLLARGEAALKDIWHEDGNHSDYLVIGDPHENYYQGSFKIKSIALKL